MPNPQIEIQGPPDEEWKEAQFPFNGSWQPDTDGTLIGPSNYQTLQNLRYKDSGLEGVNGYTKRNTNPLATYTFISEGFQLRSNYTQDTYTLVQSKSVSADGQGRVFLNRTAPGSTGDFQTAAQVAAYTVSPLDINGNEYRADVNTGLQGRFSAAPQGNAIYCNGEETTIFGGDEQRIAAAFQSTETLTGAEIIADINDRECNNPALNWANVDVDSYTSVGNDITVTADAVDQYFTLAQGNCITVIGTPYDLRFDVANLVGTWTVQSGDGAQELGQVNSNGIQSIDFTAETTGGLRIVSNETTSSGDFDDFTMFETGHGDEIDVTDKLTTSLHASSDDMVTMDAATKNQIIICTTRPAMGFKIYVDSGNPNDTTSSGNVVCYNGSNYEAISVAYNGTVIGGIVGAQTGSVILDSHSVSIAEPHHEQGLYMYTYIFELSAGDVDIYQITYNPAMQKSVDVWDGVFRQPIQFQALDDSLGTFDYTLQVNESSYVDAAVGADLAGIGAANDQVYIMFEDQMAGIRFTMLGDLINDAGSVLSMKYWDGDGYTALTISDGTDSSGTGAGPTMAQTGLVKWHPPTDEVPKSLYGSYGYVYELTFSIALANSGTPDEVLVDVCTGIPAQFDVKPFDWSCLYGSRVMLGSFAAGNEGNRMDYCVANAPDVWNGFDSSDNGKQSLYFGGEDKIVAGTQIYNRFGSSIYSMLLVLKKNETYVMTGSTPDDFTIYSVANTIGCVAPSTLATAEIGIDLGNGLTRSVAIWVSHSGPVMFDGAILTPINGVKSYFDPNDSKYIKFSLMKHAKGWVDPNYKEYNILIPSESTATKNDVWLVYDLARRRWFEKTTTNSEMPQAAWEMINNSTGQRYIYAGIDTGYMMELEEGYAWTDGVTNGGIVQKVKTGDLFPSNSVWDETILRKMKIFMKRLTDSSLTNTVDVRHYQNTEPDLGSEVIWQDYDEDNNGFVTWQDWEDVNFASSLTGILNIQEGTSRVLRLVQDLNKKGWSHAFQYRCTTSDVNKGFQPILWGVQYRVERKDNTATG